MVEMNRKNDYCLALTLLQSISFDPKLKLTLSQKCQLKRNAHQAGSAACDTPEQRAKDGHIPHQKKQNPNAEPGKLIHLLTKVIG